jgi:hypothetical protein
MRLAAEIRYPVAQPAACVSNSEDQCEHHGHYGHRFSARFFLTLAIFITSFLPDADHP